MDVGINVRELRSSGRLSAFSRALGVNEHEGLGVLVDVWHETQHRELMLVTESQFASATGLVLLHDQIKVLNAMVKAQLVSAVDDEKWLIRGNDRHVEKLQAFRSRAAKGGIARSMLKAASKQPASKHKAPAKQAHGKLEASFNEPATSQQRASSEPWLLVTGIDHDLGTSDPDLTAPQAQTFDPRSSLSSDCKSEIVLSASPSAAADALTVLDLPKPKGKQRSADQKRRSVANARLYCELYENAEKHPPSGLDASFYGMMAKFSDKHAENTETILRWVFASPDTFFRSKGWPLELIIAQAPKLWREANNPRAVVENIAAPRQQQQMALAASNDLAFEEYQRRKAERLAGSAP